MLVLIFSGMIIGRWCEILRQHLEKRNTPTLSSSWGYWPHYLFQIVRGERVFSQLKLVKTDHRSSLKSTSLLQSKMAMKNGHYCAASFKPSKRILELASAMKSNATDEEVVAIRKDFLSKLHV
jgi:hypothetical protein